MPFPEIARASPHCDGLRLHEQAGVLFHHSSMEFGATIDFMAGPGSQVSYHCLIAPDGSRCTLVPDTAVAWHAGVSSFLGRSRCNDFLLGVAFAGDTYVEPLSAAQIASALDWLEPRWERRGWSPAMMTDHRQVAPGRKRDLAPPEWARLLQAITERFTPGL